MKLFANPSWAGVVWFLAKLTLMAGAAGVIALEVSERTAKTHSENMEAAMKAVEEQIAQAQAGQLQILEKSVSTLQASYSELNSSLLASAENLETAILSNTENEDDLHEKIKDLQVDVSAQNEQSKTIHADLSEFEATLQRYISENQITSGDTE